MTQAHGQSTVEFFTAHHPGHDGQRVRQRRHPADPADFAVASARALAAMGDRSKIVFTTSSNRYPRCSSTSCM
ncbi:hypothetical protein ACU4GD_39145 [Cupriavidus basilensis]